MDRYTSATSPGELLTVLRVLRIYFVLISFGSFFTPCLVPAVRELKNAVKLRLGDVGWGCGVPWGVLPWSAFSCGVRGEARKEGRCSLLDCSLLSHTPSCNAFWMICLSIPQPLYSLLLVLLSLGLLTQSPATPALRSQSSRSLLLGSLLTLNSQFLLAFVLPETGDS